MVRLRPPHSNGRGCRKRKLAPVLRWDAFPQFVLGLYELDLRSAELRKNRLKIRLQEQPFQIYYSAAWKSGPSWSAPGNPAEAWPDGDGSRVHHSINAAVKRLRDALCESAEEPRNKRSLGADTVLSVRPSTSRPGRYRKDPVQVQPLVEDPPAGLDELPASLPDEVRTVRIGGLRQARSLLSFWRLALGPRLRRPQRSSRRLRRPGLVSTPG